MSLLLSLGVLGLLGGSLVLADDSRIVAPSGVDAGELAAFEDTVSRFTSRMNEYRDEARAMVHRREAEERSQLNKSYDAVLGQLTEDDDALRATAIRRFEAFLTRYPEATHSAHVMFRLSELYFEKSEEQFQLADLAFQDALEVLDEGGDLEDIPEEPLKDYSASIGLHGQIIDRFPEYEYLAGSYYMMGYMLREPSSAQYDEEGAQEWFRRIVGEFPDSEFSPRAHLRLGDYHFDYNELDASIPHYQRVVELEGVNGALYDDGLYKLAWTYYRMSDYDRALTLLIKLLDWSEEVFEPKSGNESATVPEAIEYIAISLSDLAHDRERSPLEVAQQFFGQSGQRDYEARIYTQLADVLSKQANYDEAIALYEHIQQRWPYDPDNPKFQHKVASLHVTKLPGDEAASNAAIIRLNETYNDNSPWWRANRNNPDALAVARGFIEESLVSVAVNAHSVAQTTGAREDYAKAADLYGAYLQEFPFASDYYEIQWYYAQVLQQSGDYASAERELGQLRKGGQHAYKEASLYRLRLIAAQRVLDLYQKLDVVPPDAKLKQEVAIESGIKRKVYELGSFHQALLDKTDALLVADFGPTKLELERQVAEAKDGDSEAIARSALGEVEQYAEGLEFNRSAMEYEMGQMLVAHGHIDDGRERLVNVVDRFPGTENACFSASLDSETYLDEEDLIGFRRKLAYYLGLGVCADSSGFETQIVQVDFQLAAALAEKGKFLEAADAFVEVYRSYPDQPELRASALQNAANNYERGGKLDESIKVLENFVGEFPDHPNTSVFLFRLAGVYAQALDLNRAISAYERIFQQLAPSGHANAPVALANAAYLRVGVGDFEGAARNYEEFGRSFPEQPDTEKLVFKAGEQWERVSPAKAVDFYTRYLQSWRGRNADHEMEAVYRLATLSEEMGARGRAVESAWDDVLATYQRLQPTGQIGVLGRHYAAHAEFRRLEVELEEFRKINFGTNDTKNAEALGSKLEALVELDAHAKAVVTRYADFEYSSGALYVAGEGFLTYSDMLFDAPMPRGLDEEEQFLYEEVIAERRVPLEDKGKSRLVLVLTNAEKQKRWSPYQSEATRVLNERFPREFAPEKDEVRGQTRASGVRRAGPVPVRTDDGDGDSK